MLRMSEMLNNRNMAIAGIVPAHGKKILFF